MDLFYFVFTWSGVMYSLHGIAFFILSFFYNSDMKSIEKMDKVQATYLLFRIISSIGFLLGHLLFNTVRYNTRFSSQKVVSGVAENYLMYQKICFTGIGIFSCIHCAYNVGYYKSPILTSVDMSSLFWLLYSLIYRIFVPNDKLQKDGNWLPVQTLCATCPFKV